MGSGKIQRQFPGKSEETDRDQTRRRGSDRSREAEEIGSGGGSDGGIETKPCPDGRKKETRRHNQGRGTGRRENKVETRAGLGQLSAFSRDLSAVEVIAF